MMTVDCLSNERSISIEVGVIGWGEDELSRIRLLALPDCQPSPCDGE